MMTLTGLQILWYFLIFLLIAGYFVLDGFDLGVGVLYPFVCKDDNDRAIARRSIGPVWDGNEVWLLTAGGALFAAFPDAYATTFSGFYLAIMLVLFALIVRAVSFEFYAGDEKWRQLWNWCFFLGSLLPALLLGVAVGNIIQGIPMDAQGNYVGIPLLGLISPFTLLTGLLGLAMFIAAGACWLALKAPIGSTLQKRAAALRVPMQAVSIVLFFATSIWVFTIMGGGPAAGVLLIVAWLLFALYLACMCASIATSRMKNERGDLLAFIFQSVSAIALVFLVAVSMFPVLVFASPDSLGAAITAASAGASTLSLTCMTVILCIGLPFVLIYHVLIYRSFRGRVQLN